MGGESPISLDELEHSSRVTLRVADSVVEGRAVAVERVGAG